MEAKGETDCLNERQLSDIVNKDQLVKITAKHCPSQAIAFWISEAELLKTELEPGQEVRLKTKGDGPFICKYNAENSILFCVNQAGYMCCSVCFCLSSFLRQTGRRYSDKVQLCRR